MLPFVGRLSKILKLQFNLISPCLTKYNKMYIQQQHPKPQNTQAPHRTIPKISYPSYYNCFNQAENIRYEYTDGQADFVAHQIILQSKVSKLYRYVPMGLGRRQLDLAIKELKLGSVKCEVVGIDRKDQICRFYRICQKGETIES